MDSVPPNQASPGDDDELVAEAAVLLQLQEFGSQGLVPFDSPGQVTADFTLLRDWPRALLCRELRSEFGRPFGFMSDLLVIAYPAIARKGIWSPVSLVQDVYVLTQALHVCALKAEKGRLRELARSTLASSTAEPTSSEAADVPPERGDPPTDLSYLRDCSFCARVVKAARDANGTTERLRWEALASQPEWGVSGGHLERLAREHSRDTGHALPRPRELLRWAGPG